MSQKSIVEISSLDIGLILVPERYDPRRFDLKGKGIPLLDILSIIREQILPNMVDKKSKLLVLDTGDAKEGVVSVNKDLCSISEIGSAKKSMQFGDVIISRLRPYLRQVAFLDKQLYSYFDVPYCIVGSTEFFVLRSKNNESIAFLVPFLLSPDVQKIFASSQEGGHHPRFTQQTLENLFIPEEYYKKRNAISLAVEDAIATIRKGDIALKHELSFQ